MRRPWGWEYVYRRLGAVKGGCIVVVFENAIAESCGLVPGLMLGLELFVVE